MLLGGGFQAFPGVSNVNAPHRQLLRVLQEGWSLRSSCWLQERNIWNLLWKLGQEGGKLHHLPVLSYQNKNCSRSYWPMWWGFVHRKYMACHTWFCPSHHGLGIGDVPDADEHLEHCSILHHLLGWQILTGIEGLVKSATLVQLIPFKHVIWVCLMQAYIWYVCHIFLSSCLNQHMDIAPYDTEYEFYYYCTWIFTLRFRYEQNDVFFPMTPPHSLFYAYFSSISAESVLCSVSVLFPKRSTLGLS